MLKRCPMCIQTLLIIPTIPGHLTKGPQRWSIEVIANANYLVNSGNTLMRPKFGKIETAFLNITGLQTSQCLLFLSSNTHFVEFNKGETFIHELTGLDNRWTAVCPFFFEPFLMNPSSASFSFCCGKFFSALIWTSKVPAVKHDHLTVNQNLNVE